MRENRCMLITIDSYFEKDLMRSLEIYRHSSLEGNKTIRDDFDAVQHLGCLHKLRDWFARNYLSTGAGVVTMFIIQAGNPFLLKMMFRAVTVTKLNNKLKKVKMLSRLFVCLSASLSFATSVDMVLVTNEKGTLTTSCFSLYQPFINLFSFINLNAIDDYVISGAIECDMEKI
ncbi:hypothetical protein D9C73_013118 [Collichthys lucidus]|uniref:Uncharacterized protein n=1 Tax=Collichthys lucidus TaxID=240159 RepID=A0A4U5USF0_COLLU|nr:hypothetical protein D9C73_013118 [Collichthys lucidus]